MSVTFTGIGMQPVPINFVKMYSDGTPMVKTDQWDQIVLFADKMILRANSLSEFVCGMFLADSIRASGGSITTLVLPYLPGARQDRSNPTGDVLFTARSVGNMINDLDFQRVISIDPHSDVMPWYINNFEEYPLSKVYEKLPNIYDGVIAPDRGAVMRAAVAAGVISRPQFKETGTGIGYIIASKHRDVSDGKITGFEVPDLKPGHYLIVDDICDGGGTFLGVGEKILEQGATADLYVTHGIFSKGTRELKKIFKNIYTTNTRQIHERNRVTVFDVLTEMENY